MVIAVGSVKGSPGASTLSLAVAAVWPPDADPVVVVEADCAGGDVGGRCWLPDTPGLASLATAARAGMVAVEEHATVLPCGAAVVIAPAQRQPATVAVGLLAQAGIERWAKERTVILDIGRLDPGTPAAGLSAAAEVVLVCTHGDESSLSRLVTAGLSPDVARLVLVGGSDYPLREIQDGVGVPVVADVPWDPRMAQRVWSRAAPGRLGRGMPAQIRVLAQQLAAQAAATSRSRGRYGVDAWLRAGQGQGRS